MKNLNFNNMILWLGLIFISSLLISCSDSSSSSETDACKNNPCASSLVPHKVLCKETSDSFKCICERGYIENTEGACIVDENTNTVCDPNPCKDEVNTKCEIYSNEAICVCLDGYTLDSTTKECVGNNPCKDSPCTETNKTQCGVISNDKYGCFCDDGYAPNSSGQCITASYGDYYSGISDSLKDKDLIEALYQKIKDHHIISYNSAGARLDDIDGKTCSYTGITGNLNTEHVWPQSYFGSASPMVSDLHHLRNVQSTVNSKRGNVHFGNVVKTDCNPNCFDNCSYDNDCAETDSCCYFCDWDGFLYNENIQTEAKKGKPSNNCNDHPIFEPMDSIKGDVARALFYFAVRYKNESINQSQAYMTGPDHDNHIPSYEEKYLRIWHIQDPVSYEEVQRNNKIQDIQKNRNPFIDRPELVNRILDF